MASDQSTRKNRVHKGVHNQKSHYEETSYNAALKPILYKQIQTRNTNSYLSAFTNAAHSNRAAFFFPATFNSVLRTCSRFCDVFLPSTLRT